MNEAVIKNMLENEDIRKGAYSFIGDTNITYADINILIQQLQTYKDKENKMKHYVHTLFFENHFEKEEQFKKCKKEILQILNEGSDKNE